jgi:hypothetical protein
MFEADPVSTEKILEGMILTAVIQAIVESSSKLRSHFNHQVPTVL